MHGRVLRDEYSLVFSLKYAYTTCGGLKPLDRVVKPRKLVLKPCSRLQEIVLGLLQIIGRQE